MPQLLTIHETVARSKEAGLPVSEYTLRRLLRTGAIPHRQVGGKYLIFWPNVERYLTCSDGTADPAPDENALQASGIRRIEV